MRAIDPEGLPRRWAPLALALAFWTSLHGRLVFTSDVPAAGDLFFGMYPTRILMGDALRHGRLFEWFPNEAWGNFGIGAIAFGFFHPFSLVWAALDAVVAMKVEIATCGLLALLGTYWLAQEHGFGRWASAVAAVAYGLCGYVLASEIRPHYLRGAMELPFVLASVNRALTRPAAAVWIAVASVVWASIFLGGDPHGFVLCGSLVGIHCLLLPPGNRLRRLLLIVVGTSLLLGVELLPALKLLPLTPLSQMNSPTGMEEGALWVSRLPELLLGGWTAGAPELEDGHEVYVWISSVTMGIGTVALAVAGFAAGGRRAKVAGLVIAVGLVLAMGHAGGLATLIPRVIPFFRGFRYPLKYLMIVSLEVAILAGRGAEVLLTDSANRRRFTRLFLGAGAAIGAGSLAYANQAGGNPLGVDPVALHRLASLGIAAWVLLLTHLALSRSWSSTAVGVVLVLAVFLPAAQAWYLTTQDLAPRAAWDTQVPMCAAARKFGAGLGGARIQSDIEASPSGDAATALLANRDSLDLQTAVLCGVESMSSTAYMGLPSARWAMLGANPHHEIEPDVAATLGVGLVVRQGTSIPANETVVAQGLEGRVLTTRPAAPRSYVAGIRPAVSLREAWRLFDAQPLRAQQEAVLEGEVPAVRGEGEHLGEARVLRFEPEHVVLEADLQAKAAVVLNDQFSLGWSARIDGVPTPIYAANVVARAVVAEPGHHLIEYVYQTPLLYAGFAMSGSGLLFLGALVLYESRRARRADSAAAG